MFADDPIVDALLRGGILTTVAIAWVFVLTRIVGVRSFSKLTAVDFVTTVAIGSLLGTAGTSDEVGGWLQAMVALVALFGVQVIVSLIRRGSDRIESLIENRPLVLMRDGVIDEHALEVARIRRDDLLAKLRKANVHRLEDVGAVVLETNGDFSILHGGEIDEVMLAGAGSAD